MELTIVSWVVNGLLGLVMFYLRSNMENQREDMKFLKIQLDAVKESYLKKEDFKDFKEELWERLDDVKRDVKEAMKR